MLAALIPVLGPMIDKALSHFLPDPEARAQAVQNTLGQLMAADLAQLEVNKEEARAGAYRGGWRPAIGWVCAAALAYQYLVVPIGMWVAAIAGADIPPPPTLDDMLWELMFGLLGMGALRSLEKLKGRI